MANYNVINCSDSEQIYIVSASTSLSEGDVVSFYYGQLIVCGTVTGEEGSLRDGIYIETYGDCSECREDIIKSAGTPYEVCLVCCPCESGETITSISVPHPAWTDLYGNTVIQTNAVQLGGANGLYS